MFVITINITVLLRIRVLDLSNSYTSVITDKIIAYKKV